MVEQADPYLGQHKILEFMQSILQSLIKEHPMDPYGYVVRQFIAEASRIAAEREGAQGDGSAGGFGTKQRLDDAAREVQDLQQMVESMKTQLNAMEQENKELKGKKKGASDDNWRSVQMDAYGLAEGGEAIRVADGAIGRVKTRTTTDVLVKMADGTERWYDIEDLAESGLLTAAYHIEPGDRAALLKDSANLKGRVKMRTTSDVLIVMADGSEQWHDIEDVAHMVPSADNLREGDEAIRVVDGAKGIVIGRTTADLNIMFDDGTTQWLAFEDVATLRKKRKVAPMAVMAVDINGDGRPDILVVGVDKNRDGVIDSLEAPNDEEMKAKVLNLLTEGAKTGALAAAVDAVAGRPGPAVLQGGKFQDYYGGQFRKIPDADWGTMYSRFDTYKPGSDGSGVPGTASSGMPGAATETLDLSHVNALHLELEQLAKDRAALMAQVDVIRNQVERVGKENQRLSSEVNS